MRNRKLFAILTLVAFMMTLLPVAAFAADRHASILTVDKTKVEADGNKKAEFTVYVRGMVDGKANQPIANEWIYVASERGATDEIMPDLSSGKTKYEVAYGDIGGSYTPVAKNAKFDYSGHTVLAIQTDENGKAVFTAKSAVAGDAQIAVGLEGNLADKNATNPYNYLTNSDITANDAAIIGTKTIEFTATSADSIVVNKEVKTRKAEETATQVGTKNVYEISNYVNKVAANGVDYYEVKFQLLNKASAPISGEKVEFSVDKSNASLNRSEATTDSNGEVKVRVYASKHGSYELEARKGSTSAKMMLEFNPSEISDFVVAGNLDEKIAIDVSAPSNLKLQLKDAAGNDFDLSSNEEAQDLVKPDEKITFEWITKPSGSDLEDSEFEDNLDLITNDNGLFKVTLPELDEEGKYVLRVALDTGKYHDFSFEAKEQGDIVKLTISYDEAVIALGKRTSTPSVKRIDADGVRVNASKADLKYSVSDYRMLASNDKDVPKFVVKEEGQPDVEYTYDINTNDNSYAYKGIVWATSDKDYTGQLVVTVVDTKENLSASYTVTIQDSATTLDFVTPEGVAKVGEEAVVKMQVLDAQGNKAALGAGASVKFDTYVVSKPEGALVSVDEASRFEKNLKEKGEAEIKVVSNKEGSVVVTGVLEVTDAGKTTTYSSNVTLEFGVPVPKVEVGAKNLTMFIGSTGFVADGIAGTMDQAPFIQDNRTFVPLRAVATALGATNEDTMWDAATQTITLVRPDLTATMTIGNNVITLSDGSTVVADVAPFIVAETGRTVIPFRAIAEAFGADVEAVFNADGTTNAVTFTQE